MSKSVMPMFSSKSFIVSSLIIYMETQKTSNSQSNLEKRKMELEESGSLTPDYAIKLQSSKQCSMGTKQTHRSVE